MKVSVAVITYNHEKYIKQTLDGILMQQTDFDFEIIIGEDASTDGTKEILLEYQQQYPDRFDLKLRTQNMGMMPNFTDILESCKGEYIAFCEGDDYWIDTHKLQKQVDFLDTHRDYALCFHDVKKYFENEKSLEEKATEVPEITTIEDLAERCYIVTNSVVLRNNFRLPSWFNKLPIGDWPLFLIQVQEGKIKKIPELMSVYRIHGGGAWSSIDKIKRIRVVLDTVKPILINNILSNKIANKILRKKYRRYRSRLLTKLIARKLGI